RGAHQTPAGSISMEECGRLDRHGGRPLYHPGGNPQSDLRRYCSLGLRDQAGDDPDLVQPLAEPDRAVLLVNLGSYIEHRCSHRPIACIMRAIPNTSTKTTAVCCWSGITCLARIRPSDLTLRSATAWRIRVRPPTTRLSSPMKSSG